MTALHIRALRIRAPFAMLGAAMLAAATLAAAGCSSQESRFFVLTPVPARAMAGAAAAPPRLDAGATVALGAVTLPQALDRPQMARRAGSNELVFDERQRWAEPLDGMVRRVLAADLAAALPSGMTLVETETRAPAAATVAVELRRFDADEAGAVTLTGSWRVLDRAGQPVGAPAEIAIAEPAAGADSAAVAAAMSRAVATLAAQIAGALGRAGPAFRA